MKHYIFVTHEGHTFQPGSESTEPDVENLQVIGFADGNTPEEATINLMKDNTYLIETAFDEVTAFELKSEKSTSHRLKDLVTSKI